MSEDSYKNLFFAMIFISLGGLLLYIALTEVSTSYDKDLVGIDGSIINLEKFNDSLKGFEKSGKSFQSAFANTTSKSGFEKIVDLAGFLTIGIWNIASGMVDLIISPFNIILNMLSSVFGVSSTIISVIIGGLAFLIIFSIWQLSKIGN
jgi:hypothetical protein